jgi:Cof subfamily protein (haloacid dehalogenase superfamily)
MRIDCQHKISLLAFDLDGTLLNSAGRIFPAHLKIIRGLMKRGVKVTVCSGRMPYSLREYILQLGFQGPFVAGNGALVMDSRDDTLLFSKPIADTDVDKLCTLLGRAGLHTCLQTLEGVYYSRDNPGITRAEGIRELAEKFGLTENRIRFLTEDYLYLDKHPVYKVAVNMPDGYDFSALTRFLDWQPGLTYAFSDRTFLEINARGTNKGHGIQLVAEYYGIPLREVCVFGDYDNDIPSFERAGISIAMGNASENLKARATYITDTNDNDGIGKALTALAGCF